MKNLLASLLLGSCCIAAHAGETLSVIPNDDGYATPTFVITDDYVFAGDEYLGRGVLEFPFKDFRHRVETAVLAVNPYGLPLHAPVVNVYGYSSKNGVVDLGDYDAGVLIAQWVLPPDLDYGEEAFLDVTEFVKTVKTKYVGFVLRSPSPGLYDLFSSLEYNLGTPSRLIVTKR
jgi:hypothetical protein